MFILKSTKPLVYHSMTLDKAKNVLGSDLLSAGWDNVVPGLGKLRGSCLSRNPNLPGGMPLNPGVIRLVLDKDILRYHNKIIPLDAEIVFSATFNSGYYRAARVVQNQSDSKYAWQEEFVIGDIKNLHRAINGIQVYTCENHSIGDSYLIDAKELAENYCNQFNIPLSVASDAQKQMDDAITRWREEDEEESDDPEEQAGIEQERAAKKYFGIR